MPGEDNASVTIGDVNPDDFVDCASELVAFITYVSSAPENRISDGPLITLKFTMLAGHPQLLLQRMGFLR